MRRAGVTRDRGEAAGFRYGEGSGGKGHAGQVVIVSNKQRGLCGIAQATCTGLSNASGSA